MDRHVQSFGPEGLEASLALHWAVACGVRLPKTRAPLVGHQLTIRQLLIITDRATGLGNSDSPVSTHGVSALNATSTYSGLLSCVVRRHGLSAPIAQQRFNRYVSSPIGFCSISTHATSNALGDGPTFTTIDFPGATATQPFSINSRGDVVGFYTIAGKTAHGFLLSGGQYTAIDFPGAISSWAYGINLAGDIVGQYNFTDNIDHSFLLKGREFTKIDYPGAVSTDISAINPRGDIVGFYMAPTRRLMVICLAGTNTAPLISPIPPSLSPPESTLKATSREGISTRLVSSVPIR